MAEDDSVAVKSLFGGGEAEDRCTTAKNEDQTTAVNEDGEGEKRVTVTEMQGDEASDSVVAVQDDSGGTHARGRDAITERNARESPLLRLPAELRMKICELAVGGHVIQFQRRRMINFPQDEYGYTMEKGWSLGLAIENSTSRDLLVSGLAGPVCRQISTETIGMQYKANTFRFQDDETFQKLYMALSQEQINHIQKIAFGSWCVAGARFRVPMSAPVVEKIFPNLQRVYLPQHPNELVYLNGSSSRSLRRSSRFMRRHWIFDDLDEFLMKRLRLDTPEGQSIEVVVLDPRVPQQSLDDVNQVFYIKSLSSK